MIGIELTPEYPLDRIAALGSRAEAQGFDAVFASCHYNNRDPLLALDRIAHRTESIRLGPGVANPYETHPVTLASRIATLDETSDGRAIYGIGAGDRSTLRNLGIERDQPLRRVREAFGVARDLFAGHRVTHTGTFTVDDAGLNYAQVLGEIPVYVGAQGPQMIRMAAKHADGVLFNGSHPRDIEWANRQVQNGVADRSDEREGVDFTAYTAVSLAEDVAGARAAARPPVAFIAAGAAPAVLDRHGLDHGHASQIGEYISAGEFDAAFDAVSDAMIDAFCIAGTPPIVADAIDDLLEFVDSVVVGAPLGPDLEAAIELAGRVRDLSEAIE